MPPRACPLPRDLKPYKCRACPLHPLVRIKVCAYYRGQIRAGVPWHWKADRYYYRKGEYFF